MNKMPLRHKLRLERDIPESESDIDVERELRIIEEAKHVTGME